MACGLPCIASNIPEHREIIKHQKTGILSKSTGSELAKQIQKLLNNKTMQHQLGEKARQLILKHFNIKNTLKNELIFLRTL